MKINFATISQKTAEALKPDSKYLHGYKKPIIISITAPEEPPAKLQVNFPTLRLQFDDVEYTEANKHAHVLYFYFSKEDARRILKFVSDNEPDLIITHCKAGVCRSSAVNAALSLIMTNNCDWYFEEKVPNMLVFTTLLQAYFTDILESSEINKEHSAAHLYPYVYKVRWSNISKKV